MKKIILAMFILILPLALVISSSNSTFAQDATTGYIQVQTVSYSNGAVMQGFYFSVNENFLVESGATETDVQGFRITLKSKINSLKNLMIANFTLIYLENPKAEFSIGEGGGLEILSIYDKAEDVYGFQLKFNSKEAWDFYHPKTDNEQGDENPTEQESFIITIRSQGQNIFAQEIAGFEGTVGEYFQQIYLSAVQGIDVSQTYNPLLVYDYAISSSKVRSNADSTYIDANGLYHHIWQRTIQSSVENDQIVLYYYQVQTQWWYLAIIGAAITFVLVGCGTLLIYNRYKNKK